MNRFWKYMFPIVTFCLSPFSGSAGLAFTPSDLLGFQSSITSRLAHEADLLNTLARSAGEYTFRPGVSTTSTDSDTDPEIDLAIEYRFDSLIPLKDHLALLKAQQRFENSRRRDVRNALRTHGRLLRQDLIVRQREKTLQETQQKLSEAQSLFDASEITGSELRKAQLEVVQAQIEWEQEKLRLQRLQEDAHELGFNDEAIFEPVHFALPEISTEETLSYKILALELQIEEESLRRERAFGLLSSISLDASRKRDDLDLTGSLGLSQGRPSIGGRATYTFLDPGEADSDTKWTIELQARIQWDSRSAIALERAQQDFANAQADLTEYVAGFERDRQWSLAAVDLAMREHQLALEIVEAARQQTLALETELESLSKTFEVTRRQSLELETELGAVRTELDAIQASKGEIITIESRISTGTDDAEEEPSGTVNTSSADLDLSFDSSGNRTEQIVGLRFNGIIVPQGATITRAYIQFKADEAHAGDIGLLIEGESSDDAATFTDADFGISSRPRTTESVSWSPMAWRAAGEATSV
ncbi:MAG: TolC family protein, partial [Trueperaceae bacterium]